MGGVVEDDARAFVEVEEVSAVRLGQHRIGERRFGFPGRHDPTGEDDDMIGATSFVEVVGGHHDGDAPPHFRLEHGVDSLVGRDVEPRQRFVEEQYLGLLGKSLGHEDPLALTPRQLAEVVAPKIEDPE